MLLESNQKILVQTKKYLIVCLFVFTIVVGLRED